MDANLLLAVVLVALLLLVMVTPFVLALVILRLIHTAQRD